VPIIELTSAQSRKANEYLLKVKLQQFDRCGREGHSQDAKPNRVGWRRRSAANKKCPEGEYRREDEYIRIEIHL